MTEKIQYVDLHVHGRTAAGTSKEGSIYNFAKNAARKGIGVLGTGDCLHPEWIQEIVSNLRNDKESGTWIASNGVKFILTAEVNCVFEWKERTRKIHHLIAFPDLEALYAARAAMSRWSSDLDYDGRPTLKVSAFAFVEAMCKVVPDIFIMPCHIWTPWYGVFGSNGFDSLYECYGSQTKNISCLETGISADPGDCAKVKEVENFKVVSFSDAHSPWLNRLGRESVVMTNDSPDYHDVVRMLSKGDGFVRTIEYPAELGKYHYSGHRKCGYKASPEEFGDGLCKVCHKPMTTGVVQRIGSLRSGDGAKSRKYRTLIPLKELFESKFSSDLSNYYLDNIINKIGSEYAILEADESKLKEACQTEHIYDLVKRNIENKITIDPGFDGEYGEIRA